ncbi:hypothetical protein LCGC14_0245450 [marine sediment metagenome]|uniref:Terminase n=1 Tax=marine sediment metagenome TaxID=412755 RepID=A0A0F9UAH0_9ZZZZ
MLVNTEEFRREAVYFQKHKRYDDGELGSPYWHDWWDEQQYRSLHGYEVGGVKVSGYFYWYLNFCPIWLVRASDYGVVTKNRPTNARKAGERVYTFPDFWDEDYRYFTSLDIAEYGITLEDYKKLPIDLELIEEEDNLSGGHHMTWLKPRGVGASFKGGALPARNYFCIRGSKSFCYAFETEYLTKDGIVNKFLDYREFVNEHALGFAKSSDFKKDTSKMHWRASYDNGDGKERGYKSEVMGVTLKDNTDKARGKRGKIIVIEEAGMFPGLLEVIKKGRPSVEEVDYNFGTIVVFGTGGSRKEGSKNVKVDKEANLAGLRALMYNPSTHNMLRFNNVYDPGMEGTDIGLFTSSIKNPQYKDKDGNSLTGPVKALREKERKVAAKSTEPLDLILEMSENPYNPSEALLETRSNPFISKGLLAHRNRVQGTGLFRSLPIVGRYEWIGKPRDKSVKFYKDDKLKPVWTYPHSQRVDNTGAILLYEEPVKIKGIIPPDLYILNVDAYRFAESTGVSLGAAYMIKVENNFTRDRGDILAASYVGRPPGSDGQEDFNHTIFKLAVAFNAKIAFENDEDGDIIGYAKRKNLTHMLQDEFQMAYDETLKPNTGSKRKFGVKISSGRNDTVKRQGDLFFKKWLYKVRWINEDGEEYFNYHTINDLGLLQELCQYNLIGNFDRVASMRVGMYFLQELLYEERTPTRPTENTDKDSLWNTRQFSNDSYSTETTHPCIAED